MRPTRILLLVAMALTLAGCAATGGMSPGERNAAIGEMMTGGSQAATATDEDVPPLPEAAREMLTPPPLETDAPAPVQEPRFDITADRVAVAEFYHGLVEDTPYNVVVHPEVAGTVSLRLNDVSVPEVMDILSEGYGYHYQRTDGSYLVLPSALETRVFRLDYINVQREGVSGTSITGGEITSSEEEDDANDSGEVNGSSLITRSSSRIWSDIETAIEEIIAGNRDDGPETQNASPDPEMEGPDEGDAARVVISPEAGAVVVRASPEVLDQVERFMSGLQATLNRQVILEARIVEITLSDEFEAGIDWDLVGNTSGRETTVDLTPSGFQSGSGLFELGIVRNGSFNATIDALQEQGDVMVLSSPRVSTLNNQKALIKVGTDSFFQTGVQLDTTISDGNTQTDVDPEFRSFFSGISLDVTPNINADGFVTLHVQPSVSNVTEIPRSVQIAGGETIEFRLASSDVRQSDSIVRARNGDLIVIGGLMEQREETIDAAVPGLGQIPPVNLLFSRQRQVSEKIELVILLRPTVVEEDTWRRAIDTQLEQML
ncbi:pilus (MSHA type) biogenesis protein MshL [Spiribacter insolitus]|uniref:Pilus (MSHA type) biogenesis protein MshL n=1 Tax=Spiribacter insolitus TaxID=3122417 RepID=A0ABV3T5Z6_9GAMM